VPQVRLGGEVAELDVFGGATWCCHGASFSSEVTPSLQGITICLGLRFSYVRAELSKKIGVSQFGFGGGLRELVFAEKRGVVGEVTFSSTITPRPQASPFYLGFQFLHDRKESSQKTFGFGNHMYGQSCKRIVECAWQGLVEERNNLNDFGREVQCCHGRHIFFHNNTKTQRQPNIPWILVSVCMGSAFQEDWSVSVRVWWSSDRIRCFWRRNVMLLWKQHLLSQPLQPSKPAQYSLGFSFSMNG
jgi:hypothetical protein